MLDPRAVATLGIGYSPAVAARIGLWDVATIVPPDFIPGGRLVPGRKSHLRDQAKADTRLALRCAVHSSARLAIPAIAAVDVESSLISAAGLSLPAAARVSAMPEITADADAVDVVLEMLLLSS